MYWRCRWWQREKDFAHSGGLADFRFDAGFHVRHFSLCAHGKSDEGSTENILCPCGGGLECRFDFTGCFFCQHPLPEDPGSEMGPAGTGQRGDRCFIRHFGAGDRPSGLKAPGIPGGIGAPPDHHPGSMVHLPGLLFPQGAVEEDHRKATLSAVFGIIAFLNVPIVYYSVHLWRLSHPVVFGRGGGGLHPLMLHALIITVIAFTSLYVYLMLQSLYFENCRARWEEIKNAVRDYLD